jgi:hypothetical protein
MERPRRAPAVEKSIPEISESDIKVRVIGHVKKLEDTGFTLENEGNNIRVESQEKPEKGALVRVFARPTLVKDELVLSAELIQDIKDLNEKVYKKIKTQGL